MTGIEHELNFWRGFVKTPRFLEGWCSKSKTPELPDLVYNFITERLPSTVLDCGSGVCSILNGTVPNDNLTVCDLLGDEYAKFFDYVKYDIVKPRPLACEDLPFFEEFDIVHISNALDHTQNIVLSYKRLWEAVKPGGYLIIQGFENEGLYENWQGLHQHNIKVKNNKLVISNKHSQLLELTNAEILDRKHLPELNKYWITYIAKK